MKVLYFDCFSGVSGDMTVGALLDLGIDAEAFKGELSKLNLDGYHVHIDNKMINGIRVTDFDVVIDGHDNHTHCHEDHKKHEHAHSHGDSHHNHDCIENEHGHNHHHTARNLGDIERLINSSALGENVKDLSIKIFREIARAEAKVHNKSIEEVHFHEVGAVDSIIDIVGSCICIDMLGVDKVFSSPMHDGHGFIKCQHGMMPVPVPAVMEMLTESKIPLISEDINTELVTPTGLGIIKSIALDYGNMPSMTVDRVGYGAGKRNTGRFNALRVVMGTMAEDIAESDEIVILETNIDDMSGEFLGFLMERLFENGALDAFYTPVYMKKNRPGVVLTVICGRNEEELLVDIILKNTTTLGIRSSVSKRHRMDREIVKIETDFGEVGIKIASKGDFKKAAPEYEDCKKIARKTGLPLGDIYSSALEKAKEFL